MRFGKYVQKKWVRSKSVREKFVTLNGIKAFWNVTFVLLSTKFQFMGWRTCFLFVHVYDRRRPSTTFQLILIYPNISIPHTGYWRAKHKYFIQKYSLNIFRMVRLWKVQFWIGINVFFWKLGVWEWIWIEKKEENNVILYINDEVPHNTNSSIAITSSFLS